MLPAAQKEDLAIKEAKDKAEAAYQALSQGDQSSAACSAYYDAISHLLDCRALTEDEISRYILGNYPSPSATSKKILLGVYSLGIKGGGGLSIIDKLVQVLSGLTKNGHFDALQEVIYTKNGSHPFWTYFSGTVEFQSNVVRKVPKWLYMKFRNTRPIVETKQRTPEDAAREAVGIFEPYDIEDRYELVTDFSRRMMEEQYSDS